MKKKVVSPLQYSGIVHFFETSGKENINIEEAFHALVTDVWRILMDAKLSV